MYVDEAELARVLELRDPTSEQTAAMTRVLTMATVEIDAFLDREDDDPVAGDDLSLAEQVCVQRAAELWGLQEVPLGLAGIGGEFGTSSLGAELLGEIRVYAVPAEKGIRDRVTELVGVLEAMADQIRGTIRDVAGWEGTQVEAFWIPNPTPPSIDVYLADPGREVAETGGFGETDADSSAGEWVNVRARVSTNDARANQRLLIALCDPESEVALVQALYDDPTLGGLVADLSLESQSGFRPFPTLDGSAFHLGVLWLFLVLPARS